MASKKSSAPAWQLILEDIQSQNRATIEAVEALRGSLEERIERLDRESRDRDGTLALAIADLRREVRQNTTDITGLRSDVRQNSADITGLRGDVQQNTRDIAGLRGDLRQNTMDSGDLKVMVKENTVELRTLANKVDALNRLEERVAALERRAAG